MMLFGSAVVCAPISAFLSSPSDRYEDIRVAALMDTILQSHLLQWLQTGPRRLERLAAFKDVKALLETAPAIIRSGSKTIAVDATRKLLLLAGCLYNFLKRDASSLLRASSEHSERIITPYAGAHSPSASAMALEPVTSVSVLGLGCFNPGRTGLSQLGTDALLHWRLWAISAAMQDHGLHVLALPGSRLPPGALLPEKFPMSWVGTRSVDWNCTGFFIDSDLFESVVVLDEFCCERVCWICIQARQPARKQGLICCSFYCCQGGDLKTWSHILESYAQLKERFAAHDFVLLGDANTHLSYVVDHPNTCGCLHCRQGANDVLIEAMINHAGLRVINPAIATHDNGSILDLVLVPTHLNLQAYVYPDRLGGSDHRLVSTSVSLQVSCCYTGALGRISWLSGEVWDAALSKISVPLQTLEETIADALGCVDLRPTQFGGTTSKKLRRAILDSAAWARDVLVVIAGHIAGAVKVRGARRPEGGRLSPSDYAAHEDFKAAVKEASAQEQFRIVNSYARLRQQDQGASEKFLSSFFNKESQFRISLLDEDTGQSLSEDDMLSALVEDMMARADNDFPADNELLRRVDTAVAEVRRLGGFSSCDSVASQAAWSDVQDGPYTEAELERVLQKCKSSKRCLHGCFALLKAQNTLHRQLLLSLANLSRHVGLTSTIWSLRQFAHIRKSGSMVVRRIQCLRPISLTTDMAHLVDGLWLNRNRLKMEALAGPCQVGGVSGTQLLLLAILLLAQVRDYQGLPLYLAILDLKWAFDVARLNNMRLACSEAGVCGIDWLLIDDVFSLDRQCVHLHGLLSQVFVLGCGIAQGRRFSVHVFNCLLSGLRNEVRRVLPDGVCAWLPRSVMRAVSCVDLAGPNLDYTSMPQQETLKPFLERFQKDALLPHQQAREVQEALEMLPSFADRCALLDALGSCPIEPLQYVDDTTIPCSSPGAVRCVVNKSASSACTRYATRTKSQFHYGKNKTCAMALLSSPPLDPCSLDCEVVSQKTILGVLFDQDLTFEPLLRATLARAWSMFVDLFHTAETGGFSVPVLVSQVIIRLHPVILCLAAFIALVPGVQGKLNHLQWRWGKAILGCRYQRELRHHLVVAQCGWDMRLGTCLLLELVMTRARIVLLPEDHPTARLAACLQTAPCVSWFTQVKALLQEASLHCTLPTLSGCGFFTCQEISAARSDAFLRKKILRRYRQEVVRPMLLEYDRRHLAECLSFDIPVFGCSLATLGFYTLNLDWEIFHLKTPNIMWFNFRAWCLVRITARWPLPLFGCKELPVYLTCPACGEPEASIGHLLCQCAVTTEAFASFYNKVPGCPNRSLSIAFFRTLFGTPATWLEAQNYVGTCLRLAFF